MYKSRVFLSQTDQVKERVCGNQSRKFVCFFAVLGLLFFLRGRRKSKFSKDFLKLFGCWLQSFPDILT